MHIHYTGKTDELIELQKDQLQGKYAKLGKLLDGKGEKEAHMILTTERHLHNAEITVNFRDHGLVSAASDSDLFTAMCVAVDKLEKQVLKVRNKSRDLHREGRDKFRETAIAIPMSNDLEIRTQVNGNAHLDTPSRVFRIDTHREHKPMTLDEALIEMERDISYYVYQDVDSRSVSVLIRRPDGHFDLVAC